MAMVMIMHDDDGDDDDDDNKGYGNGDIVFVIDASCIMQRVVYGAPFPLWIRPQMCKHVLKLPY